MDLEGSTSSSPSSLTLPLTTPPALQQERTIDTNFTTEECNTDEANQYQSGLNVHQSLHVAPAEADHPSHSLAGTITDLGAGSAQAGDYRPSHSTCRAGSLTLTEAAGTGLSGGPRAETDNIARGQGREGASQNTYCVTPGQETRLSNAIGNFLYYR
jgi:hypothetical protein